MRYLHVCDMSRKVYRGHPEYDPLFKVSAFQRIWSIALIICFLPCCFLVLDESLVHEFEKTKFKVIIITKLVRYGIKTYFVTDVNNYYVIKSIGYSFKAKVYS